MNTIIEHFENGEKIFETEQDFIEFVKRIFKENEGEEKVLTSPETYQEAVSYMEAYCDNFIIKQTKLN